MNTDAYAVQIVEFYAPWCGHCQNLKPAYEKAAKNLEGLARVAAMNCDDDANKPFCGSMGVQGFPTLKIVRPGKKPGKPRVEDYQGQRSAKDIVEAVVDRINNHVKRVTDKDAENFIAANEKPKAILFSEKGTTSALLKSIAIDFLDVIDVAQVRNKETATVEKYGVETFPTLVLIPSGGEPIKYDGEMKKADMVKFLSQAGSPNPDPAPVEEKKSKKADKKAGTSSSSKSKAKASSTSAEPEAEATETVKEQTAPVIIENPPIPSIHNQEKLIKECLHAKAATCVLAFVPETETEKSKHALDNLAELSHKHHQSKRNLFPIFAIPSSNPASAQLLKSLDLGGDVDLIAINARRGWWRHYEGGDFNHATIESWIDAIRMSEGVKKKLPEGIVAIEVEEAATNASPEASSEPTVDVTESVASEDATPVTEKASREASTSAEEGFSGADPTVEAETAKAHDEL